MNIATLRSSALVNWLFVALLAGVVTLAILWRFWPWMQDYMHGDDLAYLLSFHANRCATNASDILTVLCQERFRPVASAFVILEMSLFDAAMPYYTGVNVAIQVLIGLLVFAVAQRLSGGRRWASLGLALTVVTSRFALFHVTQAIGPVESLALLCTVGTVYCVIRADEGIGGSWGWAWSALALAFLAIHTHERFVVVAAWLFGAFIASSSIRALGRGRLLTLLAAAVFLPAFYVSYKTFGLDSHFMIGTGGTNIEFDLSRILEHALQAFLSIFGFNRGPDYLVGTAVSTGINPMFALACTLSATWLGLFVWAVWTTVRTSPSGLVSRIEQLRWPLLLLALSAFLLVPTLLTVRVEQRWLLPPFFVVMLVAAWSAGKIPLRHSRATSTLLATMIGASLVLDGMVMRNFDRVFLMSSARFVEVVKQDVIDKAPDAKGPVTFIAGESNCSWSLVGGSFFAVYGAADRPVQCVTSLDAVINADLEPTTTVYADDGQGGLKNVTADLEAIRGRDTKAIVDFLEDFARGQISSRAKVDTPTGLGALQMPWDSTSGTRSTLTLLSGFSYRYDEVEIPAGARLDVAMSMIYPAAQSARLVISLTPKDAQPQIVLSEDLVPPVAGEKLRFAHRSVALDAFAGQQASITFAVQSPGGDSSGHWVGMASPRIVVDAPARP